MAKLNYEHVFAAAGFSGECWDVAKGYDRTYSSPASAASIAVNKHITMSSGTFPDWMQKVGTVFKTDSANNPGPFSIDVVTSTTDITVRETVSTPDSGITAVFNGS